MENQEKSPAEGLGAGEFVVRRNGTVLSPTRQASGKLCGKLIGCITNFTRTTGMSKKSASGVATSHGFRVRICIRSNAGRVFQ